MIVPYRYKNRPIQSLCVYLGCVTDHFYLLLLIIEKNVGCVLVAKKAIGAPVVGPEEGMVEIVILLIMLTGLLDIAALKWGVNSVDDIDSPEWERRQRWYGSH
jgi:hypothetical protein